MLVGIAYRWLRGDGRTALLVGALVLSHWLLDAVVHVPDLPLAPGLDPRIGLGLWNSPVATLAVEVPLFALGVWLYASCTRSRDRIGSWGLIALVAFLARAVPLTTPQA